MNTLVTTSHSSGHTAWWALFLVLAACLVFVNARLAVRRRRWRRSRRAAPTDLGD